MSRVCVIAGGAGGLGRALGAQLAQEGFDVVALDLPGPELDAVTFGQAVACDMTNPEALTAACAQITERHNAIDLVIYAQGITHLAAFDDDEDAPHRKVFEVNYFASVALARHMLGPVRRAGGVHLALSSVAGFAPLMRRAAYAASKHALQGFFHTLRSEEAAHGVEVLLAAPSFVATNPKAEEGGIGGLTRPGAAPDAIDHMSAEAAAEIILKGYHRRRKTILVGRLAWLSHWAIRLWPGFYERRMRKRFTKG